jgi:3-hydroxyacyl-[acyl-carrier-protein] dehydratase
VDYDALVKSLRKKPLARPEGLSVKLDAGRDEIERIIPQREPILLVDRLTGLDREAGVIAGERWIDPADPVFNGHFPDFPVYPGSYTVEMIGQLGLCLHYFLESKNDAIAPQARPLPLRATRILSAVFLEPILPGKTVTLLAQKLEFDGFLATAVGQAIVDGKVACVSVGEVAFLQ